MSGDLKDIAILISASSTAGLLGFLLGSEMRAKDSLERFLAKAIPTGIGAFIAGAMYGARPGIASAAMLGAVAGFIGQRTGECYGKSQPIMHPQKTKKQVLSQEHTVITYLNTARLVHRVSTARQPIIVPVIQEPPSTLEGTIYVFQRREVFIQRIHPVIGFADENGIRRVDVIVDQQQRLYSFLPRLTYQIVQSDRVIILCGGPWDLERKTENAKEAYREQVRQHYRRPQVPETPTLTVTNLPGGDESHNSGI